MSYKLSITFNTFQELSDFVKVHGTSVIGGTIEAAPKTATHFSDVGTPATVTEAKAPAKKAPASKKEKEAPVEVESKPASAPAQPPVQQEVSAPSAPVEKFDRDGAIKKATELVAEIKASGIADTEVMPNIHAVYTEAGCPLNLRISQFDDVQLSRFLPLFAKKVASIVASQKTETSFI